MRRRGVAVSTTPDVLTNDVADQGLALLVGVARRVSYGDRYMRAGEWAQNGEMPLTIPKVFINVTTSATATAEAAAHYAIALAKSDAMADVIKQCKGCILLETRVQSLGSATKDRPTVTASLLQKYGAK